jgi:hypothetical protein
MFLNRPGASYAKAVVLDLVNPARSGRRMLDWPRQTGLKTRRGPIGLQSAAELTRNRHRVECKADAARVESAPAFRHYNEKAAAIQTRRQIVRGVGSAE